MAPLVILALAAIVLPWFSSRVWPFVLWSLLAAGLLAAGTFFCIWTVRGWDGLARVVVAFLALFPLAASIAVGIVRVVSTGGGRRPAKLPTILAASAISYGIATLAVVLMFVTAR